MNPIFRLQTPQQLGLKVTAFSIHGLANHQPNDELQARLTELHEQLDLHRSRLQIAGFEALRQQLGCSACPHPPSPRGLLQQFLRDGRLCRSTPVVDLCNHWSLLSGLSIVAHDLRQLRLPVSLVLSQGQETFVGLDSQQPETLPAGEYIYLDADQQVIYRMDYHQSAVTALSADSRAALIIVQGHGDTPAHHLCQSAAALQADLDYYCTGPEPDLVSGLLDTRRRPQWVAQAGQTIDNKGMHQQ